MPNPFTAAASFQLLRMKGFWREMGRTLCQEGGIQAEEVGRGTDTCWEGKGAAGTGESGAREEQQEQQGGLHNGEDMGTTTTE